MKTYRFFRWRGLLSATEPDCSPAEPALLAAAGGPEAYRPLDYGVDDEELARGLIGGPEAYHAVGLRRGDEELAHGLVGGPEACHAVGLRPQLKNVPELKS